MMGLSAGLRKRTPLIHWLEYFVGCRFMGFTPSEVVSALDIVVTESEESRGHDL